MTRVYQLRLPSGTLVESCAAAHGRAAPRRLREGLAWPPVRSRRYPPNRSDQPLRCVAIRWRATIRSRWPPPQFSNSVIESASSSARPACSPWLKLVQVGAHIVGGDHAGGDRDHEVAALGQRGQPRVDEDLGPPNHLVVDLAMVGKVRADAVEVSARTQPLTADQRILRHRRRADDVGLGDRCGEIVGDGVGDVLGDECSGALGCAIPHHDTVDRRPHGTVGSDQMRRQPTGADHQQRA